MNWGRWVFRRLRLLAITAMTLGAAALPIWAQLGANFTDAEYLNTTGGDTRVDGLPRVATDGAGTWLAVWQSEPTSGSDQDIRIARSTDKGVTWSAWTSLNTNAQTDAGDDFSPGLVSVGVGEWVAVWNSDDSLDGTIGTDVDILFARSTDDGLTWSAPAALNSNAAGNAGEDLLSREIESDGAGTLIVSWSSDDSLGGTIGTDTDILYSRSSDNGLTWSAAQPLNSNAVGDTGGDDSPHLENDENGHWVATWTTANDLNNTIGTDLDIAIARSADNGLTWTAPEPLDSQFAGDTGIDFGARVATDRASNWVVSYVSRDDRGGTIGTDADLLVMRSVDNGATWTTSVELNSNAVAGSGDDLGLDLRTDGAGNWICAWQSRDSLGGSIGTDSDILVSRSTDLGATWSAAQPLNSYADTDASHDSDFAVQLANDGSARWVAVWVSDYDLLGEFEYIFDILVTHWDYSCDVIDDDHDGFTECEGDCNDSNDREAPGFPEECDGVANDCNAPGWPALPADEVDEDLDSYPICAGDCDDTDRTVFPYALETCNGVDDDCNSLVDDGPLGFDTDGDRVSNACDNCIQIPNPGQSDFDFDSEGDACDLDDGVIQVFFDEPSYPRWQEELGFSSWNVYRGDLGLLMSGGDYTQQVQESNPLARRDCGLAEPWIFDDDPIPPGAVAHYLTTGVSEAVETDLGTDSEGQTRPNTHPCP